MSQNFCFLQNEVCYTEIVKTPPMVIAIQRRIKEIQWREFVCGWGAACINISITYPLNKIIFRQMLHHVKISSAYQQLAGEGYRYLYRGILPPLVQKSISLSCMFGMYEEVRRPLSKETNLNPFVVKAMAGFFAGCCEVIVMPFERVQTLLADSSYYSHFRNTFHTFRTVFKQYGYREYYRGIAPILLRNGPSNVLFFTLRDEFKLRLYSTKTPFHTALSEFFSGALIGAVLSTVFFPLNVVKVKMQSRLGGPHDSMRAVFKQIYKSRGGSIPNFYYGVHMNITKSCISWGVMNTAYEQLKNIFYAF